MENKVFVATCNRCDEEGGFRFIGKSGIFGLNGEPLAKAGSEPEVIVANLNLPAARDKRNVNPVTGYATEVFAARQPDLYDVIVSGQELPTVPPELEDDEDA
jgi:predicted amidohydrolase